MINKREYIKEYVAEIIDRVECGFTLSARALYSFVLEDLKNDMELLDLFSMELGRELYKIKEVL